MPVMNNTQFLAPSPGNTTNTTSNLDNEDDGTLIAHRIVALTVPIVFGIIFIVGTVGNGTLIFTVLRNKPLQNIPNILIMSLALGDLLLILVSVPFTATIYTFKSWPYGEPMCKMNEFLQTLSLGVSVFTLTALSGDRFMAIVYPMRMHRGSPKLRTILIACAIWVFSSGLALMDLVAAHTTDYPNGFSACHLHPYEWGEWYPKFQSMFRFIIYFALPLTIIALFYVSMAYILWNSGRRMPGESQRIVGGVKSTSKQIEGRKKVAKLILSFIIVFIFCWLPRHVFLLWYHYDPADFNMFWYVFKIIGFCLCFINSCINPVALYLLSQQFRKYFNRYLFCCCFRGSSRRREMSYYTETSSPNQMKMYRQVNGVSPATMTATESCL